MLKATPEIRYYAFVAALGVMLIAIPTSNYLMSIAQFLMAAIWLWDGFCTGIINKFRKFFANKTAVVLTSLFVLHVIGMLFTSDFSYGWKDLRTKLPLLILPIMLSATPPLKKREINYLLLLFSATVIFGTLVSMRILFQSTVSDFRELSPFISHIRFSLNICISIYILLYFVYRNTFCKRRFQILFILAACWLILYLFILKSLSGLMVFFAFLLIVIAWFIYFKKSIYLKLCFTFLIIAIPFLLIYYIYSILDKYTEIKPVNFSKLATHSANGTPYLHDTVNFGIENGHYVGLYIAEKELRETWNRRSTLDYDGKDLKNQQLKFTLIRYLSSRNLNKDSVGITQLTNAEIHYIEKGIANTNYLENFGLKTRVIQAYQGLENYYTTGDPSANSFAQRLEYWKASIALIKSHFFTGVGTGDMNEAFIQQYEKMHSQLNYKFRRRSHNQFFSVFVAFGVIGFSWFCFTLLYPVIVHKKWNDYLYMLFFFTAILSMLVEDTIETQAGVTFFAFFNAFFLFCTKKE